MVIARPVSKYGDAPLENKWLLLLCEQFLYFRLGGIESIALVSPETMTEHIADYMEYKKAVPLDTYISVAQKTGAHYIVYLQCEYNRIISDGQVNLGKNTDINFFGKVIAPGKDAPVVADAKQFPIKKLGQRLDTFVGMMLDGCGASRTDRNRNFLQTRILSVRGKKIKKLGEFLAMANASKIVEWEVFYKKYHTLVVKNSDMLLGYFAGVTMCEEAGKYKDAAHLSHALMDILDTSYPDIFAETCKLYRLSGNYSQAWNIINMAPAIPGYENDMNMERAFLLEQQGDVRQAADIALDVQNARARQFYSKNSGYVKEKPDSTDTKGVSEQFSF